MALLLSKHLKIINLNDKSLETNIQVKADRITVRDRELRCLSCWGKSMQKPTNCLPTPTYSSYLLLKYLRRVDSTRSHHNWLVEFFLFSTFNPQGKQMRRFYFIASRCSSSLYNLQFSFITFAILSKCVGYPELGCVPF